MNTNINREGLKIRPVSRNKTGRQFLYLEDKNITENVIFNH